MARVGLPDWLSDKRVIVLGAGAEGRSTVRWLAERGLAPAVADRDAGLAKELAALGVSKTHLGPDYLDHLADYEVAFRTPLLPAGDDRLTAARQGGLTVTSQTRLFFELVPATTVGVTGTKGKGTTVGLIAAMLAGGGRTVAIGGNIGTPPLELLEELTADHVAVLELSSFQLEDLDRSPAVAVVTNVTADHLDRHADVAEYRAAKRSVLSHQGPDGLAVLNADDPGAKAMAEYAGGRLAWFSVRKPVEPGAFVVGESLRLAFGDDPGDFASIGDIPVPGSHNRSNVLAASVVAAHFGVRRPAMAKAVRGYRGLPYHLELVREHNGVRWFNDSYSTNPQATVPAVESFDVPLVLILGGEGKKLPYDDLAAVLRDKAVRSIVSIPPEGPRATAALAEAGVAPPVTEVADKSEIVPAAAKLARSGDVVLFSPAATSYGWFENKDDRGRYFSEQVAAL